MCPVGVTVNMDWAPLHCPSRPYPAAFVHPQRLSSWGDYSRVNDDGSDQAAFERLGELSLASGGALALMQHRAAATGRFINPTARVFPFATRSCHGCTASPWTASSIPLQTPCGAWTSGAHAAAETSALSQSVGEAE